MQEYEMQEGRQSIRDKSDDARNDEMQEYEMQEGKHVLPGRQVTMRWGDGHMRMGMMVIRLKSGRSA
jgi:hypothetical protein